MRHISVWLIELFKLYSRRQLHPLRTKCPFCQQMIRLHVNKEGRRHMYAHARALYEGARFYPHYAVKMKCPGSRTLVVFDPHPNEQQHFKLPNALR
jgi:hypothetical protein